MVPSNLSHWICAVCQKVADYNAMGFFLCKTHWEEYLKNPIEYLKSLKRKKK